MAKRVSLGERREKDKKGGLDALFVTTSVPENPITPEKLVKATYYIRADQVVAVESIQLSERQRSGKRRDKSELVQEAIDLLIDKYS